MLGQYSIAAEESRWPAANHNCRATYSSCQYITVCFGNYPKYGVFLMLKPRSRSVSHVSLGEHGVEEDDHPDDAAYHGAMEADNEGYAAEEAEDSRNYNHGFSHSYSDSFDEDSLHF